MQEAHASPLTEKQHDDHHARTTRLKFAGTHIRLHPEDLPHDYEPGEVYRGLDEYIAAPVSYTHLTLPTILLV